MKAIAENMLLLLARQHHSWTMYAPTEIIIIIIVILIDSIGSKPIILILKILSVIL